jgi:hypothetical protein
MPRIADVKQIEQKLDELAQLFVGTIELQARINENVADEDIRKKFTHEQQISTQLSLIVLSLQKNTNCSDEFLIGCLERLQWQILMHNNNTQVMQTAQYFQELQLDGALPK